MGAHRTSQKIAAGHGERMSRKAEQLISNLLIHSTIAAAAKATGITALTAGRWLAEPAFQRRYERARAEVLRGATNALRAAATAAVRALLEVCERGRNEQARVSAARTVLEMGFRAAEIEDLAERIERLEGNTDSMEAL